MQDTCNKFRFVSEWAKWSAVSLWVS